MPRRYRKRKTKYVTKRALPFLLAKNSEAKRLDYEEKHVQIVSSLPIQLDLSAIPTGDTQFNRIGNHIQVTGVYAKFLFSNSEDLSTPTDKAYYARVVLWMPKGDLGVIDLDAEPATNIDPEKYTIFMDKTVPIPWVNSISNSMITIKKRFKPYMKVVYDGTGSGSVEKNKLMLSCFVNNDIALTEVSYNARVYWRDL